MPVELATAYVSLVPSARGLSQAIHKELVGPTGKVAGDAGDSAGRAFGNRFSGAVSGIVKAGAIGLIGLAAGATKLLFDAVGGAEESLKVARQTESVIQSTGGTANVTARQLGTLVDALSAKAGIDDELIQSGANVLLTFTRVRNEVGLGNDIFNQATGLALDMSVALGQDLQSSVTQLGKALNDPIAGISALARVGVTFTEQQKEQIRTLVESGDVLGAQKLILQELTTEFGGSAEAQATATDKLKVAFGNVSEQIGGVLLPYVELFADWINREGVPLIQDKLVPAIESFASWIRDEAVPAIRDELLPRLGDLVTWVRDNVIPPLETMGDVLVDKVVPAIQDAATWIGDHLVPALQELVPWMDDANEAADKGTPSWLGWAVAIGAVAVAAAAIVSFLSPLAGVIKVVAVAFALAGHIIVGAILFLISPVGLFVAAVVGAAFLIVRNWDTIRDTIVGAVGYILDFLGVVWPTLVGVIYGPIGLTVGLIIKFWDEIVGMFRAAAGLVGDIWSAVWDYIWATVQNRWSTLVGFFTALPGAIAGFFASAGSWLLEGGRNIMRGLWNGITEIWAGVTGFFAGIGGTVVGYFADAGSWLYEGGKNIVTGLWNGIKAVWEDVVGWFKDLPGKVLGALGIASPPQWAIDAGKWILKGITKGLGLGVGSVVEFMSGLADRFTGPLRDAWRGAMAFVSGDLDIGANISGFLELGETLARSFGWTGGQWAALRELWGHESGWNPSARNPSSGAYGIPQSLPASKMGPLAQASNADLLSRAAAQITWGLGYISSRYGNPINALNMWNSRVPHWYGTGGVLPETGLFGGHRGEVVFTPDQMRVLGSVISAGATASGDQPQARPLVVQQHNYGITDYRELARRSADEVAWTMRVAG